MDLCEYQDLAMKASTHPRNPLSLEYCALALCGEAGELANLVKKRWRTYHGVQMSTVDDDQEATRMADELGDVLWYVQATATKLGFSLEDVAQRNLEKLRNRGRKE